MKKTGIPIGNVVIKDGKIIRKQSYLSASAKIAQRKSKKVTVKRKTP